MKGFLEVYQWLILSFPSRGRLLPRLSLETCVSKRLWAQLQLRSWKQGKTEIFSLSG